MSLTTLPTLHSSDELADLVTRIGFLPFFHHGIENFSVEEYTPASFWFQDGVEGPWEWKTPVIVKTHCAYGKFFCGRAGYISKDWYLDFANWRRQGYDFDARYDDGLAAYQDKLIYETLASQDSLLSTELKQKSGFGKGGAKGFDSSLTRLQMEGYVVTCGFEYKVDKNGNPYGWGLARYCTSEQFFGPSFARRIYKRTPEESKTASWPIWDRSCPGPQKNKSCG